MFTLTKKLFIAATVIVAAVGLSACTNAGTNADEAATDRQLQQYQQVQPIPFYDWSQYRQTVMSVQDAQAKGTATTSFFFNQGVANPIKVCASIGYPVATTTQLTNPTQWVGSGGAVIDQMEPTGVYTVIPRGRTWSVSSVASPSRPTGKGSSRPKADPLTGTANKGSSSTTGPQRSKSPRSSHHRRGA